MPDDGLWGWLGPLLVTAFGAFLRFNRLRVPRTLVFDETYYAKDAWSILQHGVEWNVVSKTGDPNYANDLIIAGHTHIFAACQGVACGEYVVQPEMGKLLIAAGEWVFGLASFVRGAVREMAWLPVTFVVIPLAVYLASWSGWFAAGTGYDRDYARLHGVHTPVISALYSLYEYHLQAIRFGLGLRSAHPYQSQPWDWLVVTRPVAFFYQC
jgi:dolichyl-phosphate-mannose--protein O-mannosyl transferase